MSEDYCVCCGAPYETEGDWVCGQCREKYNLTNSKDFFKTREFLDMIREKSKIELKNKYKIIATVAVEYEDYFELEARDLEEAKEIVGKQFVARILKEERKPKKLTINNIKINNTEIDKEK